MSEELKRSYRHDTPTLDNKLLDTMKSFFILTAFALSALAQQATIISPTNGSTITAGSQLVVEVHQDVQFLS